MTGQHTHERRHIGIVLLACAGCIRCPAPICNCLRTFVRLLGLFGRDWEGGGQTSTEQDTEVTVFRKWDFEDDERY